MIIQDDTLSKEQRHIRGPSQLLLPGLMLIRKDILILFEDLGTFCHFVSRVSYVQSHSKS